VRGGKWVGWFFVYHFFFAWEEGVRGVGCGLLGVYVEAVSVDG
jgi:hypothetical protein